MAHRTALITGGTRGIGFGIAEALAAQGYALGLNGRRPEDEVRPVMDALRRKGAADVAYAVCDVADVQGHAAMLDAISEKLGRIDVLVNNAGVAPEVRADLLEATPESFDRLIRINLRGPYFLTQAVAQRMIASKRADDRFRGAIVNVTSISATVASVNRGDYCISKAGLGMSTALWAARLGGEGIGVFEVRPGVIKTDMTAGVTDKYDKLIAGGLTAVPRWGYPQDVGTAVAALASGEWLYATGSVIMVDGGLTISRL